VQRPGHWYLTVEIGNLLLESMRIRQAILGALILANAVICVPISGYGIQVAVVLSSTPSRTYNATATVQVPADIKILSDVSTLALLLTGDGAPQWQPVVNLTWNASPSVAVTYNVYRSSTHGECFKIKSDDCKKINLSPVAGTTYADNTVQGGQSYFYVAKAVGPSGKESSPSNEAQAVISAPKK
jgi:hypothetical protein